jgi:hypothetical protein
VNSRAIRAFVAESHGALYTKPQLGERDTTMRPARTMTIFRVLFCSGMAYVCKSCDARSVNVRRGWMVGDTDMVATGSMFITELHLSISGYGLVTRVGKWVR